MKTLSNRIEHLESKAAKPDRITVIRSIIDFSWDTGLWAVVGRENPETGEMERIPADEVEWKVPDPQRMGALHSAYINAQSAKGFAHERA